MNKLHLCIIAAFLFVVSGCSETHQEPVPTNTVTEQVRTTPANPTATPSPTPTFTPTPSPTPTSIPVPALTSPNVTPTPTPFHTNPTATPTTQAIATPVPSSIRTPTPWPTPTPTPTPWSAPTPTPMFTSVTYALTVRAIPTSLPVYDRGDWNHWVDADGDCQDTRAEVLINESAVPVSFDGCRVVSGEWNGFFNGQTLTDASKVDIDHMVPLSNAHRSGGWQWDSQTKKNFANDISETDHLIAVSASANRSKGDRGPEAWKPTNVSYWCQYAKDWAAIKARWQLSVTNAELIALQQMTSTCQGAVYYTTTVIYDSPIPTPTPTPSSSLLYDPFGADRNCGDFPLWADAQAFFEAAGGPTSDPHRLDGNADGIACQSLPGAP